MAELSLLKDRYNAASAADEEIAVAVFVAIVTRAAPEPLRTHLQVNSSNFKKFGEVRDAVGDFVRAKSTWTPQAFNADAPTPMDVDWLNKSKGKGKGKDKFGKPKGKGKGKDKDGKAKLCFWCGKPGHVQSECRAKLAGKPRTYWPPSGGGRHVMEVGKAEGGSASTASSASSSASGSAPGGAGSSVLMLETVVEEEYVSPFDSDWVFAVDDGRNASSELALDSACFDHVCGLDAYPTVPLVLDDNPNEFSSIRTADGTNMKYLGNKYVGLWVLDNSGTSVKLKIRFRVLERVKRTLISIPRLAERGFEVTFNTLGGHIAVSGSSAKKLPFSRQGRMFYLKSIAFSEFDEYDDVNYQNALVAPVVEESIGTHSSTAASSSAPAATFEREGEEGQVPKGAPLPQKPSDKEVREHELTHIPFRTWCAHCVAGRARSDRHTHHHVAGEPRDGKPVIQLDYCQPTGKAGPFVLSIVDVNTGFGGSTVVSNKGGKDRYAIAFAATICKEIGHTSATIQTDGENSATDFANVLAGKLEGQYHLRTTPVNSSQSNGSVERFHGSMQAMSRTLISVVERAYKIKVDDKHVLLPWLACQTRCLPLRSISGWT